MNYADYYRPPAAQSARPQATPYAPRYYAPGWAQGMLGWGLNPTPPKPLAKPRYRRFNVVPGGGYSQPITSWNSGVANYGGNTNYGAAPAYQPQMQYAPQGGYGMRQQPIVYDLQGAPLTNY